MRFKPLCNTAIAAAVALIGNAGHASRASNFPTKCLGNSTRPWNDRRACRRNCVRAYTPPHACTLEDRLPVSRPPKPVFPYEARMSSFCMQQNPVRCFDRSTPLERLQMQRELYYVASSASSVSAARSPWNFPSRVSQCNNWVLAPIGLRSPSDFPILGDRPKVAIGRSTNRHPRRGNNPFLG
jgi:hypothetical protein